MHPCQYHPNCDKPHIHHRHKVWDGSTWTWCEGRP